VRIILLSSFTIGLPQYEIVIRGESLFIKLISSEQRSETGTAESQMFVQENLLVDDNKSTSSKKNFSEKLLTNLNSQSSSSFQNKSLNTKSSVTSIEVNNEAYEPLIDVLLDLSDIVDLTECQYGDSMNLILINRALVLFDLMKNLDDKYFMENYAFKLGKLIDNIVMQVCCRIIISVYFCLKRRSFLLPCCVVNGANFKV
jgi:hypothetical protein